MWWCYVQLGVDERRAVINDHCDGLVNEIETKREFFLSDLEYEERSKRECLMNHIESLSQESRGVQSLVQYANAVLRETDPCAFIQVSSILYISVCAFWVLWGVLNTVKRWVHSVVGWKRMNTPFKEDFKKLRHDILQNEVNLTWKIDSRGW
jgi:hypothetical protein